MSQNSIRGAQHNLEQGHGPNPLQRGHLMPRVQHGWEKGSTETDCGFIEL